MHKHAYEWTNLSQSVCLSAYSKSLLHICKRLQRYMDFPEEIHKFPLRRASQLLCVCVCWPLRRMRNKLS